MDPKKNGMEGQGEVGIETIMKTPLQPSTLGGTAPCSVLFKTCSVMQDDNWKMYVSTSYFVASSPECSVDFVI